MVVTTAITLLLTLLAPVSVLLLLHTWRSGDLGSSGSIEEKNTTTPITIGTDSSTEVLPTTSPDTPITAAAAKGQVKVLQARFLEQLLTRLLWPA